MKKLKRNGKGVSERRNKNKNEEDADKEAQIMLGQATEKLNQVYDH
jgi:hypothetical protein